MIIIQERLREILDLHLASGSHISMESGLCVMEAASYVAAEPWSDSPPCVCPVIGSFMRAWNDGLPSDAERDRLLKPLISSIIDTKSTSEVEERRSYLALDWLVRVYTPKWLDLVASLASHAKALRDLSEIADMAGATAAGTLTRAVWAAAWDAARDAAGDAAGAAAGDAARDAAWAAAGAAAGDAVWDAAGAAAGDAARAAAWAAAWDAAWAALKPTTEWLQVSALELVQRMLDAH
jgi:hypothetical protein